MSGLLDVGLTSPFGQQAASAMSGIASGALSGAAAGAIWGPTGALFGGGIARRLELSAVFQKLQKRKTTLLKTTTRAFTKPYPPAQKKPSPTVLP